MQETREVHRSWVAVLGGAGLLAFLFTRLEFSWTPGWLGGWELGLALIAVISGLFWFLSRQPTLVIDEHGFSDRRTQAGTIPWSQIERVERCGVKEVRLVLNEPLESSPANRRPFSSSEVDRREVLTNAWGLRIGYEELVELLQETLRERLLVET